MNPIRLGGRNVTIAQSVLRRSPDLLKMLDPEARRLLEKAPLEPPKKRIQQSHKPMLNKLEAEWLALNANLHPNYPPIRPQAKTYRLANGVRYTPDFSASIWPDKSEAGGPSRETCWEIKGPKAWDDAIVKVKVAAAQWPEVQWILCWKEMGQWQQQVVLP